MLRPMATVATLALGAAVLAAPALAQSADTRDVPRNSPEAPAFYPSATPPQNPNRVGVPPRGVSQRQHDQGGRGDVNAAFMGGGVILQGAPGAPAPTPEATPPGQRPRNMVEPGTPLTGATLGLGTMGSGASMGTGGGMGGTGMVGGPSTMDRPGMGPTSNTRDATGSAPVLTPGTGPNTMAPGMGTSTGMGVTR